MMSEEVYYNEGVVYKQSRETQFSGGGTSTVEYKDGHPEKNKQYFGFYKRVNHPANIWPFLAKESDGNIKVYYMPKELVFACVNNYGKWKVHPNASISHIKLPKELEIIVSIACNYGEENGPKEIYFLCESYEDMKKISEFYNLPTPLSKDNDFNTNDVKWKKNILPDIIDWDFSDYTRRIDKNGMKMASIKFDENGVAEIFKVYRRCYI